MLSREKRRVLSIVITVITLSFIWLISCALLIYFKYISEIRNSCEYNEVVIGDAIQIRIETLEELMRNKSVDDGTARIVIHLMNLEKYLTGKNCNVEWKAYKETEHNWSMSYYFNGMILDTKTTDFLDGSQRYVVMTNADSFYDILENDMGYVCPLEYL